MSLFLQDRGPGLDEFGWIQPSGLGLQAALHFQYADISPG